MFVAFCRLLFYKHVNCVRLFFYICSACYLFLLNQEFRLKFPSWRDKAYGWPAPQGPAAFLVQPLR